MEDKTYTEIIERLAKIEVKIDDFKGLREGLDRHSVELTEIKGSLENQQKEIEEMRESNKWLRRAFIGALITATVGIVFCFIKIGLGVA